MKSGIELIAEERREQIEKHGRTVEKDRSENGSYQLAIAASKLLAYPGSDNSYERPPMDWDNEVYQKMRAKNYRQRLVIAGALIAAELDRLNQIETPTE